MIGSDQPSVISHWYQLFEDYETSALDFYTAIEEAVAARNLPKVEVSRVIWKEGGVASAEREYLRIARGALHFDVCAAPYGNAYFFSWWLAKRTGNGFLTLIVLVIMLTMTLFFSSLLMQESCVMVLLVPFGLLGGLFVAGNMIQNGDLVPEEVILDTPFIGRLYQWIYNPTSYYRQDTVQAFQQSVGNAVMEALDGVRAGQGLRALSPDERKPQFSRLNR